MDKVALTNGYLYSVIIIHSSLLSGCGHFTVIDETRSCFCLSDWLRKWLVSNIRRRKKSASRTGKNTTDVSPAVSTGCHTTPASVAADSDIRFRPKIH